MSDHSLRMSRTAEAAERASDDDDTHIQFDDIPLHQKRPFGSGIARRPIKFVPASSRPDGEGGVSKKPSTASGESVSNMYLSMVLAKSPGSKASPPPSLSPPPPPPPPSSSPPSHPPNQPQQGPAAAPPVVLCEVCNLPLPAAPDHDGRRHRHETTLAHQASLPHSHPPSALDRSRMGLAYLQAYGWDPDERRGLGAQAQGIVAPLRGLPKDDTLGLGAIAPGQRPPSPLGGDETDRDRQLQLQRHQQQQQEAKRPRKLLDAGRVRKMELESRKRSERLNRQVFGNMDLEKYLGPGAW